MVLRMSRLYAPHRQRSIRWCSIRSPVTSCIHSAHGGALQEDGGDSAPTGFPPEFCIKRQRGGAAGGAAFIPLHMSENHISEPMLRSRRCWQPGTGESSPCFYQCIMGCYTCCCYPSLNTGLITITIITTPADANELAVNGWRDVTLDPMKATVAN